MGPEVFLLLLLQLKHFYVDFVNQTNEEILSKGIYGDKSGIMHSAKHGICTAIAVWIVLGVGGIFFALLMGLLDGVLHYHIDYAKSNWGCQNKEESLFWNHLGLDQMLHQLTYIGILGFTLL